MDIFKLVGSVFVDTDSANESLSKTDTKASSVGETLGKVGSTAAKVGTAVVGAATAAVSGLVALETQTASNADAIDKASIRMGVSAEAYQEYAYAAELAGVDTSTLEQAAKKLEGTDINFDDAMDQIMSLGTAEERSAKAAELFGEKVAYNLSPMIEQSGEDFAAAKQEAEDLGLVMSNDSVKAGASLNDTFTKIQESGTALMNTIGQALLPIINDFATQIVNYMPQIQSMISEIAPIATSFLEKLLPIFMDMADSLLPVIFDLIEQLMPLLADIASEILPIFTELVEALAPFIVDFCKTALPVILDLLDAVLPIVKDILTLLSPILNLILALLTPLLKLIDLILPPIIELMEAGVKKIVEKVEPAITKLTNFVTNFGTTVKNVFNGIKTTVKTVVNSVLTIINGLIRGVTSGMNAVSKVLNNMKINVPSWVTKLTGVKSFGFNIPQISAPQIPLLAKGGIVDGGAAIVGEDGPELLQSNGNSTKVTPLNDNNNDFVELNKKLDTLIDLIRQFVGDNVGVYIDGSALVGAIAPGMNKELGRLSVKNARGVF